MIIICFWYIYLTLGQKAHKLEIGNLELATFSMNYMDYNELVSLIKIEQKFNFLYYEILKLAKYFLSAAEL